MKAHFTTLARQRGNTLTGIIIGLVIGLGIAVAVALLITKSSTPFTNKGGKDKPDQPLTQLQDPNKPLYGNKDAVKEANKDVLKDAPKAAAEQNTVAVKPADSKIEVKPAAEKPATADKPAEKPAEVVKIDPAVEDKYTYYLQTGAFREVNDAESARAKLALIGFEAKISEKNSDTGTMYRVRVGPYPNAETMNRNRAKLSENGVDVAIVKTLK
ncbi:MAG: SPOR domain-containing protein [Undibacterium curvum]|uniref:SPOR domain-containing protein n=1 Tax=Undibacterium curvum TaxID=2762294 RepID=A0ABR7A918_9BURK|nr:SPOR domain-containing protein [Undibacterium curvum]MBC3933324.1 SPOR domain-containing protein [Undibacterium curvum]